MGEKEILRAPFMTKMITSPRAEGMCYISGTIYTACDAAYLRLVEMLERGEEMSFDFEGQVAYYAGPCPAKFGQPVGSAGPTTGGRVDAYSPMLVMHDLCVMTGKGLRSPEVADAVKQHKGVYFAAIGGVAALMGKCVKEAEVIAFGDLGPEATRKLRVEELPVIVAVDSLGGDIYSLSHSQYARR